MACRMPALTRTFLAVMIFRAAHHSSGTRVLPMHVRKGFEGGFYACLMAAPLGLRGGCRSGRDGCCCEEPNDPSIGNDPLEGRSVMMEDLRKLVRSAELEEEAATGAGASKQSVKEFEEDDSHSYSDSEKETKKFLKLSEEQKNIDKRFYDGVDLCMKDLDKMREVEANQVPDMPDLDEYIAQQRTRADSHFDESSPRRPLSPLLLDTSTESQEGITVHTATDLSGLRVRVAVQPEDSQEDGGEEEEDFGDVIDRRMQDLRLQGAKEGGSSEGCSDQSSGTAMLSALKDLKAWRQSMKKNEIALEDRLVDADEDDDEDESDGEGAEKQFLIDGGASQGPDINFEVDVPDLHTFAHDDRAPKSLQWLEREGLLERASYMFDRCGCGLAEFQILTVSRKKLATLHEVGGRSVRALSHGLLVSVSDSRRARTHGFEDLTGLVDWKLTRAMVAVLFASGGSVFRERSVVELGCGTGMLGISAALLGSSSVILTDRSALSLAVACANARMNGFQADSCVRCEKFEWGAGVAQLGTVDVVLASECIHYAVDVSHRVVTGKGGTRKPVHGISRFDALISTAASLIARNESGGIMILCVRLRERRGGTSYEDCKKELQDTGTRFGMAHTEMIDMRDLCSMVGVTDKKVVFAPEVVGCVLCIMSSSSIAVKDALAAICDGPRKTP